MARGRRQRARRQNYDLSVISDSTRYLEQLRRGLQLVLGFIAVTVGDFDPTADSRDRHVAGAADPIVV